jgi:Ycf66 protein N-terminus
MVNFGLNSASILGIFLAVAGAGLYFMRTVRPELSRDHDIFFAAVGLLCGFILLFQGWRLDPILQFGQFLLTGTTIFFAVETIRLRQATAEQARRSGSYVDEERRVSKTRAYTEAEYGQIEPEEEEEIYPNKRRLRGADYESDEPRSTRVRRTTRPTSGERYTKYSEETERPRRRGTEPTRSDYWAGEDEQWSEEPKRPRRREDSEEKPTTRAPKRSKPLTNQYGDEPPAAYVDYQPLDESEEEPIVQAGNRPKVDEDYHEDSEY